MHLCSLLLVEFDAVALQQVSFFAVEVSHEQGLFLEHFYVLITKTFTLLACCTFKQMGEASSWGSGREMTLPRLPAVLHKQLVILIDQQQRKKCMCVWLPGREQDTLPHPQFKLKTVWQLCFLFQWHLKLHHVLCITQKLANKLD